MEYSRVGLETREKEMDLLIRNEDEVMEAYRIERQIEQDRFLFRKE